MSNTKAPMTGPDPRRKQLVAEEPVRCDAAVLDELIELDPDDDRAAEALRHRYCLLCRHTRGSTPSTRDAECTKMRCGLRLSGRLAFWQLWTLTAGVVLKDLKQADQNAIRLLNLQVFAAAATTPGLSLTGLSFSTPTLLALIHASVIVRLANHAGEIVLNAAMTTGDQARDAVLQLRGQIAEQDRERALAMLDAGESVRGVARRLGIPRTTVDGWNRQRGGVRNPPNPSVPKGSRGR